MEKHWVYIITNKSNKVLYIGMSKDLKRRIYQHKNKVHPTTFSAKYNLNKLIYFEVFETKTEASVREKQLKKWNRDWRIELIETTNPNWEDLYKSLK